MKKVNELYLVACQTDTFTQCLLEEFKEIAAAEEGEAALWEWAHIISTGARLLGETARAAIKRHKEGEENEST